MANSTKIRAGYIKRIHINRHILRDNVKTGRRAKPISIQMSGGVRRAAHVWIHGPAQLVYGDKPLKCGARVWIQTWETVEYI